MAFLWFDCTRSGDDSTLAGHSETDSTLAGLKFPDLNGLRMCRTVSPSLLQGGNFSRQVPASLAGPLSGPFRLITCNLLSRILVKLSPCPVPLKLRVSDSEWLSRSPMALRWFQAQVTVHGKIPVSRLARPGHGVARQMLCNDKPGCLAILLWGGSSGSPLSEYGMRLHQP
jgi:hypothetical protein